MREHRTVECSTCEHYSNKGKCLRWKAPITMRGDESCAEWTEAANDDTADLPPAAFDGFDEFVSELRHGKPQPGQPTCQGCKHITAFRDYGLYCQRVHEPCDGDGCIHWTAPSKEAERAELLVELERAMAVLQKALDATREVLK